MAGGRLDWMIVHDDWSGKRIGAIGFIGNDAVAVAAFYDDIDGNEDGTVSLAEWIAGHTLFSLKGKAVTKVVQHATADPDILVRDTSLRELAAKMFLSFATGLIEQGIYKVYFAPGVSAAARGIAVSITDGMIKQFVIRKGFEAAVKKAFMAATGN